MTRSEPWFDDRVAGVMWDLECVITVRGYCYPITSWLANDLECEKGVATHCVAGWEGMAWWTVTLAPFRKMH